ASPCASLNGQGTLNWQATQPTGAIQVRAFCDGQSCPSTTGSSTAAAFSISYADITLSATQPVALNAVGGPLLNSSQPISGVQTFTVNASDVGPGVARVLLYVDGQLAQSYPVADAEGTCHTPYTVAVPCPLSVQETFSYDTSGLAPGAHRFQVVVQDATLSEANQSSSATFTVDVAGSSSAGVPGQPPRSGPARLTVWLSSRSYGRGARRAVVAYGSGRWLVGRLLSADGTPISSGSVTVLSQATNSDRWQLLASAVTSSQGLFSLHIPGGPSRLVRVVYPGAQPPASSVARLLVRARVWARFPRVIQRGAAYVFRGAIAGPAVLPGTLVEFQGLALGRWVTFAVADTGRHGRFHLRYAFAPGPTVVHELRVLVPAQRGLPYLGGASSPGRVLVLQ
ncbi:MAG TPA: hypothetical protein VKV27_14930, partial [Solirubrobacteraceae bacterium]|nr:hypothetical protein [Solirubrobacteraceae bacterium]